MLALAVAFGTFGAFCLMFLIAALAFYPILGEGKSLVRYLRDI